MTRGHLRRLTAVGAISIAAVLTLGACGGGAGDQGAEQDDAPQLVEAGKLKTCTNLPYPPFQDKQGDDVVGFDVDMIDLAAKELSVKQEIVDIDFDAIKSGAALTGRTCDVAAAGMTITDERKKNLDFSDPYFDEILALTTKKDSGVTSLDDVKAKGLKLGVQAATTSLDLAKDKGLDPRQFKNSGQQLSAFQTGQVDVVLQDLPVVLDWEGKGDFKEKYEIVEKIETGEQYGFAIKKGGDPKILKAINDSLAAAIKDGTWAKLYEQWMGFAPESTPSPE